jgi:hypothetical protein
MLREKLALLFSSVIAIGLLPVVGWMTGGAGL